jgi:2-phosphosulfolactate phosphatase
MNMKTLEVLFTPADFAGLQRRNLDDTTCVVIDVFRATSSMVTALANGATAVIAVAEIPEALELRRQMPQVLLAGERDGLRIRAELTGGVDFDMGNSPREFVRERVLGRTIVTTTTNGTRALRAGGHSRSVLVGSFLNLGATAEWILKSGTEHLLIVCSGTFEQAAYEDVLAAGAMCELLQDHFGDGERSDAAFMARRLYESVKSDLAGAAREARNGQRLLSRPELAADVPFCLQRDVFPLTAGMQSDGRIILQK